ncbi:MAG: cobaltochelatase subunit CobN, partial [Sphingomonadaceae bacterium]
LPRPRNPAGHVGLLVLRSYLLARDTAHYDAVIAALEARGLAVTPIFASGLDSRPAIERYLMDPARPRPDALVSLTGFSLVGGPAFNDSAAAEAILARLDVPFLCAHPLEFQTLEAWGRSRLGLTPLEATMMVAIPELDGATCPHVYAGRTEGSGQACSGCERGCRHEAEMMRAMRPCPERVEALAEKVARLVALRRTARAQRRIGVVLYDFPPGSGATGSAAFLSVWESLHATMRRLAAEGHAVDVPEGPEALRQAVCHGNAARFGTPANVHARLSADELLRREPHLAEIEAIWGPAPGRQLSDGRDVFVLGERFGNLFVGIQPPMGVEGDPVRLLAEGGFAPTHAFAAFYRWLRQDFGAHALLHFGTHGALEFMPGKQAGLSARCWPERLLGGVPNLYLYAANNPSEGMLAKRRSGATLISHLTPPLAQAGLYRALADLKAALERLRAAAPADRAELAAMAAELAAGLDIDAHGLADDPDGLALAALMARLYDWEQALIPEGLHVIGRVPDAAERATLLAAIAEGREEPADAGTIAAIAHAPAPPAGAAGPRPAAGDDLSLLPIGHGALLLPGTAHPRRSFRAPMVARAERRPPQVRRWSS